VKHPTTTDYQLLMLQKFQCFTFFSFFSQKQNSRKKFFEQHRQISTINETFSNIFYIFAATNYNTYE
jgi:hypothetical protein